MFITRPTAPLVKSYYEKHITDKTLIDQGIAQGKYLQGRLFFDKSVAKKDNGFVKVPGVDKPIKVMGFQNLNRALHLDEVVVKLCNWVQWEPAQHRLTKNIDWDEQPAIPMPEPEIPDVADEVHKSASEGDLEN